MKALTVRLLDFQVQLWNRKIMECFKNLRRFEFALCTLMKHLLFPFYWDLSSFRAVIYLKYFFLSLKYPPLISSFLPQVSLLCLSFLSFIITSALISLPVFPLVFYLFTLSRDLRSEKQKAGQLAVDMCHLEWFRWTYRFWKWIDCFNLVMLVLFLLSKKAFARTIWSIYLLLSWIFTNQVSGLKSVLLTLKLNNKMHLSYAWEVEEQLPLHIRKWQLLYKMVSAFWERIKLRIKRDRVTNVMSAVSPVCLCCTIDHSVLSVFFVWEPRPVHTVSSRLQQREGQGEEQEVHIWHSSCSLHYNRRSHDPEPRRWERYTGPRECMCLCMLKRKVC